MDAADETVLRLIQRSLLDPHLAEAAVGTVHELTQRRTPADVAGRERQNKIAGAGPQAVRARLREFLGEWELVTHRDVSQARRLLREVLVGRLLFTPMERPPDLPKRKGPGRRARFVCEVSGEVSLVGILTERIWGGSLVAPTGFEPVFQP